jgi:hypothetical protein
VPQQWGQWGLMMNYVHMQSRVLRLNCCANRLETALSRQGKTVREGRGEMDGQPSISRNFSDVGRLAALFSRE